MNERELGKFFNTLIILAICLIALLASATKPISKSVEPLSMNQKRDLVALISLDGYKHLLKNGCYDSVVRKIQTGMWDDKISCVDSYSEYNLNSVKEIK